MPPDVADQHAPPPPAPRSRRHCHLRPAYLWVAFGRLPGFWRDRAGAALVGASLMVAVGALPLAEAPKAIDFDTIILLLGVMIVVANLRLSGFFGLVSGWVVTRARYPIVLLSSVVLVSGIFSAF